MLPTGFRTFHFVSFLYFFSFLFFSFCFVSFLTILFSFFAFRFFRFFSIFFSLFSFRFFFFPFLFVSFRFFRFSVCRYPKYLTWLDDLITWSLQVKSWTFFNFLLYPNRMHSVFPRWRESVFFSFFFLHFDFLRFFSLLFLLFSFRFFSFRFFSVFFVFFYVSQLTGTLYGFTSTAYTYTGAETGFERGRAGASQEKEIYVHRYHAPASPRQNLLLPVIPVQAPGRLQLLSWVV